ncbi:hypothetical protein C8R44DRAFT_791479, partial [Mycena epipterygia]
MSASEAPVLLGRVCSSWRTISLSTPRLWCKLHIVEPTPSFATPSVFNEKLAQRLETTTTWLGRSGQRPLSVSLDSAPIQLTHPGRPITLFLEALVSFASRWQHISFTIPPPALSKLWHLTEADVPLLKSVALYRRDQGTGHHEFEWKHLRILRGSRISSFSASRTNVISAELPLRWNQLTVLSIADPPWTTTFSHSMTYHIALQIISRCPALRSFKVMVDDRPSTEWHPVVESSLQTLDLSCVGSTSAHAFTHFLNCLSLPELRNFSLHWYSLPNQWINIAEHPSLDHFFSVPKSLESIYLHNNTFSRPYLAELLGSLPSTLQRLHIEDTRQLTSSFDDDGLAVLNPAPGQPLVCPALRELVIYDCREVSDEAVLRFIAARMAVAPYPTLKHVEVQFVREITLDILPRLRSFIESGELTVAITHAQPLPPPQFSPWQGLHDDPAPRWAAPYVPWADY